eukprot:COSAG06_NODE_24237_length_668_cov_1.360281_1_plen_23_part_10
MSTCLHLVLVLDIVAVVSGHDLT